MNFRTTGNPVTTSQTGRQMNGIMRIQMNWRQRKSRNWDVFFWPRWKAVTTPMWYKGCKCLPFLFAVNAWCPKWKGYRNVLFFDSDAVRRNSFKSWSHNDPCSKVLHTIFKQQREEKRMCPLWFDAVTHTCTWWNCTNLFKTSWNTDIHWICLVGPSTILSHTVHNGWFDVVGFNFAHMGWSAPNCLGFNFCCEQPCWRRNLWKLPREHHWKPPMPPRQPPEILRKWLNFETTQVYPKPLQHKFPSGKKLWDKESWYDIAICSWKFSEPCEICWNKK